MIAETELDQIEAKLGVTFNDRNLLKQALTHESFVNELGAGDVDRLKESYERLEFLGDAVLNFAVANELFARSEDASEGELSIGRADIVCKDSLAKAADILDLGSHILRGRGETLHSPNVRDSVLEDSFEAIIGAIHVDQGYDAARDFVLDRLGYRIDHITEHGVEKDPKSAFQELVQGAGLETPRYQTDQAHLDGSGTQHYLAKVTVGGRVVASGVDVSKSKAQKRAAAKANDIFAKGIPREFAKKDANHRLRNRFDAKSDVDDLGSMETRTPSVAMRRAAGWVVGLVTRKTERNPRRRLVFKRTD